MKRAFLAVLVLALAGCGSGRYAGDEQDEANAVVTAAIANLCPVSVSKTLRLVEVAKSTYAGHDAWRFEYEGARHVRAFAWWTDYTMHDYSAVEGCR